MHNARAAMAPDTPEQISHLCVCVCDARGRVWKNWIRIGCRFCGPTTTTKRRRRRRPTEALHTQGCFCAAELAAPAGASIHCMASSPAPATASDAANSWAADGPSSATAGGAEVRRELFGSLCRHQTPAVADDGPSAAQLFAASLAVAGAGDDAMQ